MFVDVFSKACGLIIVSAMPSFSHSSRIKRQIVRRSSSARAILFRQQLAAFKGAMHPVFSSGSDPVGNAISIQELGHCLKATSARPLRAQGDDSSKDVFANLCRRPLNGGLWPIPLCHHRRV